MMMEDARCMRSATESTLSSVCVAPAGFADPPLTTPYPPRITLARDRFMAYNWKYSDNDYLPPQNIVIIKQMNILYSSWLNTIEYYIKSKILL